MLHTHVAILVFLNRVGGHLDSRGSSVPIPQSQPASLGGCAERPHLSGWSDPRGSAWVAKARAVGGVRRVGEVV